MNNTFKTNSARIASIVLFSIFFNSILDTIGELPERTDPFEWYDGIVVMGFLVAIWFLGYLSKID